MLPSRETREGMSITFWMGLTFLVLIALAIFVSLVAYPAILNWQREAVQHSNAYVQSKVAQMSDLKASYERLDVQIALYQNNPAVQDAYKAQQAAIVDQMWQTYDLIPEDIRRDVVPQDIRTFLATHSRSGK